MRRSTARIATLIAVPLVGLGAVGAVYAGDDPADGRAATPTTVPGLDEIMDLLTPEQLNCLFQNIGGLDTDDLSAMLDLMNECGISIEQLFEIGQSALPSEPVESVVPPATDGKPPAGEAPVAIEEVLAALGLDAADLECIEIGLSGTVPVGDDTAALELLQSCDVSLTELLFGLITLDDGADDGPVSTEAPATSETTAPSTGITDTLIQQLQDELGITLDSDQAQCLLDNLSSLDPNDLSAVFTVLEECGISLSDLIGGG